MSSSSLKYLSGQGFQPLWAFQVNNIFFINVLINTYSPIKITNKTLSISS